MCFELFDGRIFVLIFKSSWLLQVTNVSLYLNQPKSKEKEDDTGTEIAVLLRQHNKEKSDWPKKESKTEL